MFQNPAISHLSGVAMTSRYRMPYCQISTGASRTRTTPGHYRFHDHAEAMWLSSERTARAVDPPCASVTWLGCRRMSAKEPAPTQTVYHGSTQHVNITAWINYNCWEVFALQRSSMTLQLQELAQPGYIEISCEDVDDELIYSLSGASKRLKQMRSWILLPSTLCRCSVEQVPSSAADDWVTGVNLHQP